MDKRTFLKTVSVLAGGATLSQIVACSPKVNKVHLKNWSGNLQYSTDNIHYPKNVTEVQEVVRKCNRLSALGSRHSFNKIADNSHNLISSRELNKIISLDKISNTVTIESGIKYGELAPYLYENGYALHNLASLPHISVAGSCATATHGSGVKNSNLATAVSSIEFVDAAGEIVNLSRKDGDQFQGAVVGLGALGFVTKLTLDLEPTFNMKQYVYLDLPMGELEKNFDVIMSSGYSVSFFTDWKDKNMTEVWVKSKVVDGETATPPPELFGAKLATRNMHPVKEQSAEDCTDQMGIPGPWYERMPHFKMGFQPSTGKELQAEFFVPIEHAYEAIMAIEELHEKITPHLFVSEIRTVHEDNLWMSPCYKKNCVTLHTTWKQETDTVMKLLPLVEAQLAPFNARPHWAKLFTMQPSVLQSRIERLADFKQLVDNYDPKGKFRNAFLNRNLYTE
jgi:alditol oxidase